MDLARIFHSHLGKGREKPYEKRGVNTFECVVETTRHAGLETCDTAGLEACATRVCVVLTDFTAKYPGGSKSGIIACLQSWVARATGPNRPATRRTERVRRSCGVKANGHSLPGLVSGSARAGREPTILGLARVSPG